MAQPQSNRKGQATTTDNTPFVGSFKYNEYQIAPQLKTSTQNSFDSSVLPSPHKGRKRKNLNKRGRRDNYSVKSRTVFKLPDEYNVAKTI